MACRAPGGHLLGKRLRVLAVEAVRGHRGCVDKALGARGDGRLEDVAGAVEVDRAALPLSAHDDERQVHDDVGVRDELAHGLRVEDVATPIGDLLPAPL